MDPDVSILLVGGYARRSGVGGTRTVAFEVVAHEPVGGPERTTTETMWSVDLVTL